MGNVGRRRGTIEYVKAVYARPNEVSSWPLMIGLAAVVLVASTVLGGGFGVGLVAAALTLAVTAITRRFQRR